MCIAIMSRAGAVVPKEHLEESFRCNPDGAGFMYADNDQLHIQKGFMNFNEFYEAYQPHEEKSVAIHFRITTHGDTVKENTHPFRIGNNLGFIHTGVINKVDCSDNKARSDTFHFNEKFLVPIYKRDSRFIFKEHFKDLIKEYIGWSKLVFLNNKGHFTIVNEDKGHWDEHNLIWYSNNSYKVMQPAPAKTTAIRPKGGLTVGDKVRVYNRGLGVIRYFGGGARIGVLLDGAKEVESFPIVMVDKEDVHKFEADDWVVRNDGHMPGRVGEVTGYLGSIVLVKWMVDGGGFESTSHGVPEHKLDFWWSGVGV